MGDILLGTCSWNYDSWLDLVYTKKRRTAAEYLTEYSQKFRTAEIDSWFYKIPGRSEAELYLSLVPDSFRFTCKITQGLTLPYLRDFSNDKPLDKNPQFLSPDLYFQFCEALEPLLPRLDALMFEFEYLNKQKMESLPVFIELFSSFLTKIDRSLPIGIEIRNKNYLTGEYFSFLDRERIIPVFSEKEYMPPVYEIYKQYKGMINTNAVIRLLGGNRKEIEKKTSRQWNKIVEPKEELGKIADMAGAIKSMGHRVTVNINNHYEGSAPLTAEKLQKLFLEKGIGLD